MTTRLRDARAHLEKAPGKRIRSRLLLAAARACGGDDAAARAASAAAAVELIHSYSLVHDDLPAMDNDALRRGQPTVHIAFDEATAILVGDGLQAQAFEILAVDAALSADQRVALIACLARAAGFEGMVGGQAMDMEATDREISLRDLQAMHALKTGALIRAALEMGAIIGGGDARQSDALIRLGEHVGLAFQVVDDILDVASDSAVLGKTQGKDAADHKATYVSLMGLDSARAEAVRLRREALEILDNWGPAADDLRELITLIVDRDH